MPYEQTIENLASALALRRKDRDNLRSACRRRVSAGTQHFGTRARLPVPLTPLIGRTHDLLVVRSWFASGGPRLSTITGTAGVGKTRFALALAHDLRRQFAAEVVFVSLAALQEPANIASAIVARLDRTDDGTPASLETLCAYVQRIGAYSSCSTTWNTFSPASRLSRVSRTLPAGSCASHQSRGIAHPR